jgi:hypothetical protein
MPLHTGGKVLGDLKKDLGMPKAPHRRLSSTSAAAALLTVGAGLSQGIAASAGYVTGTAARILVIAGVVIVASALSFFSIPRTEASKKFLSANLNHSILGSLKEN